MIDFDAYIANLDWKREPHGLYEPIEYALSSGGKRLRPMMVLYGCSLFGGDVQKALPVALAVELFHNFTLLHDDIMDNAKIRRNKPTVHVRWNNATAILSGDQMNIEAYKALEKVSEDKLGVILRLFNTMTTQICEGQQYDMDFENSDSVTVEAYLDMIRLKTAVLFAVSLQMGGYMADASEQNQEILYNLGLNIGMAYQLQDDYLDTYGDVKTFGKEIGGDICENKKTFLLLSALQDKSAYTEELQGWLKKTDFVRQDKIQAVREIYDKLQIPEKIEKKIEEYTKKAFILLQECPQNEIQTNLYNLIVHLSKRES